MEPTLQIGDVVYINKLKLGGRWYKNLDFINDNEAKIEPIRYWGYGKIRRNDILLFNFPHSKSWNKVNFDPNVFYMKRCIAISGDTISIKDGFYRISGQNNLTLGNLCMQQKLCNTSFDKLNKDIQNALGAWNIKNYGPLYVPKKGDCISITLNNFEIYKKLIEWETNETLTIKNNYFYIKDRQIKNYKVKNNYYFVAGDNVFNSQDSRYWGLLEESFIVGVAEFIIYSKEPYSKNTRWNRLLKEI